MGIDQIYNNLQETNNRDTYFSCIQVCVVFMHLFLHHYVVGESYRIRANVEFSNFPLLFYNGIDII